MEEKHSTSEEEDYGLRCFIHPIGDQIQSLTEFCFQKLLGDEMGAAPGLL